jgi:predicted DNA repair protein MutK
VFLPWAITPLLMVGGLYLSFEGAEKLIEKFTGDTHGETIEDTTDPAALEKARVGGAIRTDFILSAEIMAIALAQVTDEPLLQRAVVLAVVAVAITFGVYGTVGLIVKMDDIGLHLAQRKSSAAQAIGKFLLHLMPRLLAFLSGLGLFAMLWVGGGILLHGAEELGWLWPAGQAHGVQHFLEVATGPLGGVLGWLGYAVCSAVAGLIAGAIVAGAVHLVHKARH